MKKIKLLLAAFVLLSSVVITSQNAFAGDNPPRPKPKPAPTMPDGNPYPLPDPAVPIPVPQTPPAPTQPN